MTIVSSDRFKRRETDGYLLTTILTRKNAIPLAAMLFLNHFRTNRSYRYRKMKIATTFSGHVCQQTRTFFELFQDIFIPHHLTEIILFQPIGTIFELIQDIIQTNILPKFHDDMTINVASRVPIMKNAPPPGGHVFQSIGTIFKDII
ncbi:hypothetical protein DPMN_050888 [Dreissena polymorpha]|uniref:Uncharacterized protein n=1 Tax=Dreissena polymorpha TaxID=45954 RepID=A0A9D4CGY7_DREPO|nr:hypothetical protein DPMN_050888 [Dreissena polymorpha]